MATTESFEYQANPGRIIFGSGTIQKVLSELARLQFTKPLILCILQQVSQAEGLKAILEEQVVGMFIDATMYTPVDVTEEDVVAAQAVVADMFMLISGSSTTGLGKVISIRTELYHVCIPMMYTGNEVTSILSELEGIQNEMYGFGLLF